jgi:hypothetical protein
MENCMRIVKIFLGVVIGLLALAGAVAVPAFSLLSTPDASFLVASIVCIAGILTPITFIVIIATGIHQWLFPNPTQSPLYTFRPLTETEWQFFLESHHQPDNALDKLLPIEDSEDEWWHMLQDDLALKRKA